MKVSVLIIAHNEEGEIAKCIESLLIQTKAPDEIVLINHNSIDETGTIARSYPITVFDFNGPAGSVHARIQGFKCVQGDLILCIDGDAIAAKNWVEVMTETLKKEKVVMTGSWIRMSGSLYFTLASYLWYFRNNTSGTKAADYLWGASFGLRSTEKEFAIKALQEGNRLSKELSLAYNPDDYWLALFMSKRGGLEITNRTWVLAQAKEANSLQGFMRGIKAIRIRNTIHRFLGTADLSAV